RPAAGDPLAPDRGARAAPPPRAPAARDRPARRRRRGAGRARRDPHRRRRADARRAALPAATGRRRAGGAEVHPRRAATAAAAPRRGPGGPPGRAVSAVATAHVREARWQDLAELAELEIGLFGAEAWSLASWWGELAARPRREYLLAEDE